MTAGPVLFDESAADVGGAEAEQAGDIEMNEMGDREPAGNAVQNPDHVVIDDHEDFAAWAEFMGDEPAANDHAGNFGPHDNNAPAPGNNNNAPAAQVFHIGLGQGPPPNFWGDFWNAFHGGPQTGPPT